MALVRGEIARYLTPGYAHRDNAYIGFNVVYPVQAELKPPLMIGNDCRIGSLALVGPDVVMGNRIIVDRQAEIRNSIVLDGTYLGTGIEIDGRIVAGKRLIEPHDGTVLDLDDAHLLAAFGKRRGEGLRNLVHRFIAAFLIALFAVPWLIGTLIGLAAGSRYRTERIVGRKGEIRSPVWKTKDGTLSWFHRLGLDQWPRLAQVMSGQLWLVGQLPCHTREAAETQSWPAYLPGIFGLADLRPDRDDVLQRRLEARYYARNRGLREDLKLLLRAIAGLAAGRTLPLPSP